MKKLILGISLLLLGCQEKQRPNLANTPELQTLPNGRKVACFYPGELQPHISFTSSK